MNEKTNKPEKRLEELQELFLKEEISAEEYAILKKSIKEKQAREFEDEKEAEEPEKEQEDEEEAEETEEKDKQESKSDKKLSSESKIGWIVLAVMVFAIVAYGIFSVSGRPTSNVNGYSTLSGDVQVVKMYVEGSQYILEPSSFKVGVPVRIEADMSKMSGCSTNVVIPGLGIKKTLTSRDNTIEFTPTKAGTFNIACSMNMYKGTFTVLEASGTKSNYVEAPNTAAHTCGGGSGGGCGGGCGG